MKTKPIVLSALALLVSASPSFAGKTGRWIEAAKIPSNWQPALSFYEEGSKKPVGRMFFEVEQDHNRGIARIRLMHVLHEFNKNGKTMFWESDTISLSEIAGGYPLVQSSGYEVIRLKGHGVSDQGGDVQIRLLSDATNVFSSPYNDKLYFKVSVNGMKVGAFRSGKLFNLMAFRPRISSVPFKGRIAVGVEQVKFCLYSCSSNQISTFAP